MADFEKYQSGHYTVRRESINATKIVAVLPDAYHHQVTATSITGSPNAGTLTVAARPRGQTAFEDVLGGTIDLTAPSTILFDGYVEEIRCTPAGFDGTDYALVLSGGP